MFVDYDTFFKINNFKKKYYEEAKWLYTRRFEPLIMTSLEILSAVFVIIVACLKLFEVI